MTSLASSSLRDWRDVRVMITGHTGFKGGWLALWLAQLGAKVAGYALAPNTEPSFHRAVDLAAALAEDEYNDVQDAVAVKAAMMRFRPEMVFHLAAQPLVRESYKNPLETFATNVMGTAHILEAARECPSVRAVLIVTTDKCYLNEETVWGYRERDALGGNDPYSASKACAEIVAHAYRHSFFSGSSSALVASARAGNVIGGGDWAQDRLIPDIVRAQASSGTVVLRYPHAIRPWQHILEPLDGYIQIASRLLGGERKVADAFNLGPSDISVATVGEVAQRFAAQLDPAIRIDVTEARQPHEAVLLSLDSTKAHRLLGWRAPLTLVQRIEATANWYRAYRDGRDMRQFSLDQLAWYQTIRSEDDSMSRFQSMRHLH
jgi:CDP-glucose 4,6-dehydratase